MSIDFAGVCSGLGFSSVSLVNSLIHMKGIEKSAYALESMAGADAPMFLSGKRNLAHLGIGIVGGAAIGAIIGFGSSLITELSDSGLNERTDLIENLFLNSLKGLFFGGVTGAIGPGLGSCLEGNLFHNKWAAPGALLNAGVSFLLGWGLAEFMLPDAESAN